MKDFFEIIRRFVPPYKKYVVLNILFNILASFLTVVSFFLIVPILKMLFRVDASVQYTFMPWNWDHAKDVVMNNFYYYVQETINIAGPTLALAGLAAALVILTGLKVGVTYLCSYIIIPMRSGIVRDIRNYVFDKMVTLPISFFTAARKGDVMARMSGDVGEIENSIMQSLDMMFKNPIAIIVYLSIMLMLSWKLTVFVLILLPLAGLVMGRVGKALKRQSLAQQNQWGVLMSNIEECLGGLRIIKAFNAALLANPLGVLIAPSPWLSCCGSAAR